MSINKCSRTHLRMPFARAGLALIVLILLHVITSAQETGQIYPVTLEGSIYALDPAQSEPVATLVYDFALRADRLNVEFSNNARQIAYAMLSEQGWTIGIGQTGEWQFVTASVQRDATIEAVALDWLPGDQLIATYLGREAITDNVIIVGRDMVTYRNDSSLLLRDFPYECQQVIKVEGQLGLQCTPFADIGEQSLPLVQRFAFQSDGMLSPDAPAEEIVRVDTLLQRQWIWSRELGIFLYNSGVPSRSDLGSGFYTISPNGERMTRISINLRSPSSFSLSPGGTRLLFEDAGQGVWTIFDLTDSIVLDKIALENVIRLPRVFWYAEDSFLYAVRADNRDRSTLVLRTLSGEETLIPIPGTVYSINVVR